MRREIFGVSLFLFISLIFLASSYGESINRTSAPGIWHNFRYLDQAQLQYQQVNLSGAVNFTDLSYKRASKVVTDASNTRNAIIATSNPSFWFTVSESAIASIIIICASFLLWQVFVRRYHRRILKMRPEAS